MKIGKLTGYTLSGQTALLDFEGTAAEVVFLTAGIINFFCGLETADRRSHAVTGEPREKVTLRAEPTERGLLLRTEQYSVLVGDGFYTEILDRDGTPILRDYTGERTPLPRVSEEYKHLLAAEGHMLSEASDGDDFSAVQIIKRMEGGEYFYGLGDKPGPLNRRHYQYRNWNSDIPDPHVDSMEALYKSIPFFITLRERTMFGLFFDNTYETVFNLGQESEDYFYVGSAGGNLNWYFIGGNSMGEILQRYTSLTGRCPLPQKWTLGHHQSRWGYMGPEDLGAVADNMRAYDIPCDAIHLDIDYMDGYRVFTWNTDTYNGDPKGFLKSLADRGFKPVCIIDPGVKKDEGYSVYDEGMQNGYFAKTPEGEVYVNAVWPGDAVYPDFGNEAVRSWWAGKQKFLTDLGVRGVWTDMNEPASFNGPLPKDVVFREGEEPSTHAKLHNVYGHHMAEATYKGLKAADGRRPFVITRACYAGTQKYSTAWTGDNHSIWAHLKMAVPQLCSLGLSGMPFVGTDVGGFGSDTTPELLSRWVQVGCFSPLFRNHSGMGTRYQEPWRFGAETLSIYRKYVKLRYRLIPYFYDLFREESETGAPILRPLVFHYPDDPHARECNDEFLVGSNLLVAPVTEQGQTVRAVYLPEGQWYDYWTRQRLQGGRYILREAPLDTCPIYVKAGTALPTMQERSFIPEESEKILFLDVFPGEGTCTHYLDNGTDFACEQGRYHLYRFTVREDGSVETEVLHAGYEHPYEEIRVILKNE